MDLPLVAGVFKDALEDGLGPELGGQAKQNDVFVPGPLVQTVLPNPTLQVALQYGQKYNFPCNFLPRLTVSGVSG